MNLWTYKYETIMLTDCPIPTRTLAEET